MQVAWNRSADPRSFEERHDEVAAQIRALGGQPTYPRTEQSLYDDRAILAELRAKAAPARDEMLVAARTEFREQCHRYRAAHTAIIDAQKKLQRRTDDPIYRLLFDVDAALKPPTPTQTLLDVRFGGRQEAADLYYLRLPTLPDVQSYRAATAWVADKAFTLEAQQSIIAAISRWPNDAIDDRLNRIGAALLARIERLAHAQN
jgi:hypothetical protein